VAENEEDRREEMKWRPKEGWDAQRIACKTLTRIMGVPVAANLQEEQLVEAGADALLLALMKEAIYHTPPTTKIALTGITYFRRGWFIFIEDREGNDVEGGIS